MKRSEMLSLIWESINEVEDADVLLTRMEKAGMMPPDTGNGPMVGTQYMPTHLDYSKQPDYRWEPENET